MSDRGIFDLSGKVAAVIGGGSGIGEAVTIGAVKMGAKVLCLDIKQEEAARVAATASASGGQCVAGTLDIRDSTAVAQTFAKIAADHGSLDIVICTPSINVRKPILKYSDEELDRVFAVNIKGNFHVLRAAGRVMEGLQVVGGDALQRRGGPHHRGAVAVLRPEDDARKGDLDQLLGIVLDLEQRRQPLVAQPLQLRVGKGGMGDDVHVARGGEVRHARPRNTIRAVTRPPIRHT